MKQQIEEWFLARMGKVTASRVADAMAKTKTGYGAGRTNYMMELLCQRLTGNREEGFTSAAMLRGIELEPLARAAYEVQTGAVVQEVGFIDHRMIDGFGASPDGLVGDDGLLEIKCPNTAQHVACLRSGKPDAKYIKQMQAQMSCTGRAWCDFASFDDRMPEELQLFTVRVERDDDLIEEMENEIIGFLHELGLMVTELTEKMRKAA